MKTVEMETKLMHALLLCPGWSLILYILTSVRCRDLFEHLVVCQPYLAHRLWAQAEGILNKIRAKQNTNPSATEMVASSSNMTFGRLVLFLSPNKKLVESVEGKHEQLFPDKKTQKITPNN